MTPHHHQKKKKMKEAIEALGQISDHLENSKKIASGSV
jgi:hypothetical protein